MEIGRRTEKSSKKSIVLARNGAMRSKANVNVNENENVDAGWYSNTVVVATSV